jgi:acetate kinase
MNANAAYGGNERNLSMKPIQPGILSINGGSSSIKFALYQTEAELERLLYGKIDRMGLDGAYLSFNDISKNQQEKSVFPAPIINPQLIFCLTGWKSKMYFRPWRLLVIGWCTACNMPNLNE